MHAACTYTKEMADKICARLAEGDTLRAICRGEGMPPESTVRLWALDDREGFAAQYALARDLGLDAVADEIIDIADDGSRDYKADSDGVATVDYDHIARSRLRVDSRKWYLSKLAPKRYGDKITNEHTGADGAPLLLTTINVGPKSDE